MPERCRRIGTQTWLGWLGLAIALGLGCKLDSREVTVGGDAGVISGQGNLQPGGGGGQGENPADPNLPLDPGSQLLGAACQQNLDCGSGNCVDGVCCDSPCSDLCAACNLPDSLGTCSAAPSDPVCPEANCQGQSSECRPLVGGEGGLNCETIGTCRATAECQAQPAPSGTPCQEGTGTCDGQGACLVPDKLALGAECAADADCAESHCVAGADGALRCCDSACDVACQACSAAGRCEETPATDARCEAVACPADNACRDYADGITENLCRSFGQCRTPLDCGTPEFFTSLRPDAQCVCDPASGACTLAAATACTENAECASGACVATAQGDLLCCSGACAAGLFCSSTGSGCVQCEGAQVTCDGNVQSTCEDGAFVTTMCANGCTAGSGCNDLPPVGFPCDAGECAGNGVCQDDTSGQARCCVRDCAAEDKVCSPSGSCDCPPGQVAAGTGCLLQAGDPCQGGAQCQAGLTCVDGVCCEEACGGFCERCEAGSGACVAVAAGVQDLDPASGSNCNNGFECTGDRGDCRARNGQACTNLDGSDCVSGACVATAGGGARVCCSQACGPGLSCRSTGQGCVECESAAQCGNGCSLQGTCNPLRGPGETCSVAAQCSTNDCVPAVDGGSRCCANCGPEQQCTAQGTCFTPLSEPGGDCISDSDCRIGVCESNGICCNAACDPLCETCNGSGQCVSNGVCPVVDCGGSPCTIANGNVCCIRGMPRAAPASLADLDFSCEPASGCDTDADPELRSYSCDDPSDCPGAVCCHEFPAVTNGRTHCIVEAQCNTNNNVGLITKEQICESPAFSAPNSCNPGFFDGGGTITVPRPAICSIVDNLPGWRRCTLDFEADAAAQAAQ